MATSRSREPIIDFRIYCYKICELVFYKFSLHFVTGLVKVPIEKTSRLLLSIEKTSRLLLSSLTGSIVKLLTSVKYKTLTKRSQHQLLKGKKMISNHCYSAK